jgi:hypothetical protein
MFLSLCYIPALSNRRPDASYSLCNFKFANGKFCTMSAHPSYEGPCLSHATIHRTFPSSSARSAASASCALNAFLPSSHFLFSLFHFRRKSNVSPPSTRHARNPFPSPTSAKTGGYPLPQKCRRADIFDFLPYILHFFVDGATCGRAGPVNSFGAQKTRIKASAAWLYAESACRLEAGATRKREEGGLKPPLWGTKR